MNCTTCDHPNVDHALFCAQCGASVETVDEDLSAAVIMSGVYQGENLADGFEVSGRKLRDIVVKQLNADHFLAVARYLPAPLLELGRPITLPRNGAKLNGRVYETV